jgi:hypothetical protein
LAETPLPSSSWGEAGAKRRREDPRIHAVTYERRSDAEFCSAATFDIGRGIGRGMDPRVKPEDDEGVGAFGQSRALQAGNRVDGDLALRLASETASPLITLNPQISAPAFPAAP